MVEFEKTPSLKNYPGDWIGEQADYLLIRIQQIVARSKEDNFPLNQDQLGNIVGHALIATVHEDLYPTVPIVARGAFELKDTLGLVVGSKIPELKIDFNELSSLLRSSAGGAIYRVRRALEIPEIKKDKNSPRNGQSDFFEIYKKLEEHAFLRDRRLHQMPSIPDRPLPKDLNDEVADWLINTPPKQSLI